MKSFALVLAFLVAGAIADGAFRHGRRQGRRQSFRRFQGRGRRGRQEDVAATPAVGSYGAPLAPLDEAITTTVPSIVNGVDYYDDLPPVDYDYPLEPEVAPALSSYANGNGLNGNGLNGNGLNGNGLNGNGLNGNGLNGNGLNGNGLNGARANGNGNGNIAMLEKSVPGVPGQDYPIYADVPETPFTCNGAVEGGYYADPSAQCQVFHICTADGFGGLAKYSFLCPNGTIFNQEYFICDWWFNFDCSTAETLYARNEEIRAEQEANIGAVAPEANGVRANGANGNGVGGINGANGAAVQPVDDYVYDYVDADVASVTTAPALSSYGSPAANGNGNGNGNGAEAVRDARRFRNFRRGRQGRRQRARFGRQRFRG